MVYVVAKWRENLPKDSLPVVRNVLIILFVDIELNSKNSSSGYNSEARQALKLKHSKVERTQSSIPWTRQNPFDFTGCLAHIELTEFEQDGTVKAIVGHLEHNDACRAANMKRLPAVPLHPHVYEIAMEQLESGARYEFDLQ